MYIHKAIDDVAPSPLEKMHENVAIREVTGLMQNIGQEDIEKRDYVGPSIDDIQNICTDRNYIVIDVDKSSRSQIGRYGTSEIIQKYMAFFKSSKQFKTFIPIQDLEDQILDIAKKTN